MCWKRSFVQRLLVKLEIAEDRQAPAFFSSSSPDDSKTSGLGSFHRRGVAGFRKVPNAPLATISIDDTL